MTAIESPLKRTGALPMLLAAGAVTLTGTSAAMAQDAPPVNSGKVSFSTGVDIVTEYWFRGIGQENQGLIAQPWVDMVAELYSSDDVTITGNIGLWNSLHDAVPGDAWYESDFYAGIGAEGDVISVGATYIVLYNPAGGDIFAEEIDFTLGIDATAFDLPACLSPSITLAIETDGGSDNGSDKGTYLEIAFEPVIEDVLGSGNAPVDLAIPMTLGLGIDDYYEDGTGDDDTFGFFDIGAVLSTPLDGLIPADYGSWTASVGVHVIFLGDSAQDISMAFGTGDRSSSVYATFGLSMEY